MMTVRHALMSACGVLAMCFYDAVSVTYTTGSGERKAITHSRVSYVTTTRTNLQIR